MEAVSAVRAELDRFVGLAATLGPTDWSAPSRCELWSVGDVVAHVCNDFDRFGDWLDESIAGALEAPFEPEQLAGDNDARLDAFTGVPGPARLDACRRAGRRWIERIAALDPATPQRHPRGTITVETQAWWAAGECAIHGWDIATALGREWDPPAAVEAIAESWRLIRDVGPGDPWPAMLSASGRTI